MNNLQLNHRVNEIVSELEKEYDITIIFTVDGGSRSYKLHSIESDYDLRIIFYHNDFVKNIPGYGMEHFVKEYKDDNIEIMAWSIVKTVEHLKSTDYSLLEWLHSPLVYVDKKNFIGKTRKMIYQIHNKTSIFYHYSSLATKNYRTFVLGNSDVICKKYVYIIRPILMVLYMKKIEENEIKVKDDNLIICDFFDLLEIMSDQISPKVFDEIKRIVNLKKTRIKTIPSSDILNEWINKNLEIIDSMKEKRSYKKGETLLKRSIGSTFSKLCNEVKKVIDISRVYPVINIKNYQTAIFQVMKLLWTFNNIEKNQSDMTTSPKELFEEIKQYIIDEFAVECMDKIVNFQTTDTSELAKETRKLFDDNYLKQLNNFAKVIDPTFPSFPSVKRELYDYLARDVLYTLFMIYNPHKGCNKTPQDVFSTIKNSFMSDENNGIKVDETNPVSGKLVQRFSQIIKDIKSTGTIDVNTKFNKWLQQFIVTYKVKVDEYQKKLRNIKEINRSSRLHNTIKKLTQGEFNTYIKHFVY